MLNFNMGNVKNNTGFSHQNSETNLSHPFQLTSCGHFYSDSNYFTERADYKTCLMIYTVSGEGHIQYGDKKSRLLPDSLIVINCNNYHLYKTENCEQWEFYWIHFIGEYSFIYTDALNQDTLKLMQMDECLFLNYFRRFTANTDVSSSCENMKISYLFAKMFADIAAFEQKNGLETHVHEKKIESSALYIENHYNQHIQVDELAKICNISKFHYIKLFTQIMGTTPYQYILQTRVNNAKRLLIDTAQSMDEIAVMAGFCDSKNFIMNFKKQTGITPGMFRKSLQEGTNLCIKM